MCFDKGDTKHRVKTNCFPTGNVLCVLGTPTQTYRGGRPTPQLRATAICFALLLKNVDQCVSVPEVCLLIVTKMHCSTDDKVLVLINAQNASGDHLYLCLCHGCHGQLPLSTHVSPHPSYEEVFTEVADQQIHISSFLIKRYWPIFKPHSL